MLNLTESCKIIPACLNFPNLTSAGVTNLAAACQSAIYAKIA